MSLIQYLRTFPIDARKRVATPVSFGFVILTAALAVGVWWHPFMFLEYVAERDAVVAGSMEFTLRVAGEEISPVTVVSRPQNDSGLFVVLHNGVKREFVGPAEFVRLPKQPATVSEAELVLQRRLDVFLQTHNNLLLAMEACAILSLVVVVTAYFYSRGSILPYALHQGAANPAPR